MGLSSLKQSPYLSIVLRLQPIRLASLLLFNNITSFRFNKDTGDVPFLS